MGFRKFLFRKSGAVIFLIGVTIIMFSVFGNASADNIGGVAREHGDPAQANPSPTPCSDSGDTLCPVEGDITGGANGRVAGVLALPVATASPPQINKAHIYFFWGEGCPHCAEAKPFLNELVRNFQGVELHDYEVYYVEENLELFRKMAEAFGIEPRAVPTIFIANQNFVGYNETIQKGIKESVMACLENGCIDAGQGIIPGSGQSVEAPAVVITPESQTDDTIKIPLIGEINLSQQSLLVSTLLIAFVDGVNPCSIWVLSVLLAIALQTGSRKKVLIIGFVFVTVTAAVYALFIAGLFTVFSFTKDMLTWIHIVVAIVALLFALVNIKDYFWYKEGLSFTIDDSKKSGLYAKMRRLTDASQSTWGLVSGTVVLAGGVSLVEFSCTAGFPVLWTNLLLTQQVTTLTFISLLLVYMLIYQLDELAIFLTAVFTLKSSRMEEKHGRLLKLIGGMLMLSLAAVMLINPNLMNSVSGALMIFGAAFGATILILLLHRWLLPRMGIHIGSEFSKTRKKKHRH